VAASVLACVRAGIFGWSLCMRLHHIALFFAAAFAALTSTQSASANVMIIIDK